MSRFAKIAPLAAAAVAAALIAAPGALAQSGVQSQMVCGEREHLVNHLGQAYAEAPSNTGLAATGNLVEVLTSEEGSWTILVTEPNGVTCVVAAGDNWETLPRVAMGPAL